MVVAAERPKRRRWLRRLLAAAFCLGVIGLAGAWYIERHFGSDPPAEARRRAETLANDPVGQGLPEGFELTSRLVDPGGGSPLFGAEPSDVEVILYFETTMPSEQAALALAEHAIDAGWSDVVAICRDAENHRYSVGAVKGFDQWTGLLSMRTFPVDDESALVRGSVELNSPQEGHDPLESSSRKPPALDCLTSVAN